jgi:large repetitive protein
MTYSSEVLADSPLVYWRLGEPSGTTAADASGNSRTGTYTNSPTLGVTGALVGDADTATTFDGTNDYVTIAAASWQNVTNYTVEFWIKTTASGSTLNVACRDTVGVTGTKIWDVFLASDGKINFTTFNGSTGQNAFSAGAVNDGAWHHIACTKSGTTMTVYVDGAAQTPATFSTFNTSSTIPLDVARRGNNTAFLPGTLDEFAYYGAALSSTRVAAHYTAGTTVAASVSPPAAAATAGATSPGIAAGATLAMVAAAAIAAAASPGISSGVNIAVPSAAAAAAAASPGVSSGAVVTVPSGAATAAATSPGIGAGVVIAAPAAAAAADATAPALAAGAAIAPPSAAATAGATSPDVSAGQSLALPAADATADATSPTIAAAVEAAPPAADAIAAAVAPSITAGSSSSASVNPPAADATADATPPDISAGVNIAVPAAAADGSATSPDVFAGVSVVIPAAAAVADATPPGIQTVPPRDITLAYTLGVDRWSASYFERWSSAVTGGERWADTRPGSQP